MSIVKSLNTGTKEYIYKALVYANYNMMMKRCGKHGKLDKSL
jgi:hypothetical protein